MAISHGRQSRAYEEIIDLFASGADAATIIAFHPSAEAQQRVSELLAKNKVGLLSEEEQAELDQLAHIEHLMRLVKARARAHLQA